MDRPGGTYWSPGVARTGDALRELVPVDESLSSLPARLAWSSMSIIICSGKPTCGIGATGEVRPARLGTGWPQEPQKAPEGSSTTPHLVQ